MNKKIKILSIGLTISSLLNLALILNNSSITNKDIITYTYENKHDNEIVIDFSDCSYAIIDHDKQQYIFQPSCMGDWDMNFNSYEHLKMAIATYFEDKDVKVIEE